MLLSIVIPVYNREQFIDRCLASVFNQDFTGYEILAVDDGSTDASFARLSALAGPQLTVIRHSDNRGVGAARNRAIAAAVGEWIVHLDSDDELTPGALGRIADVVAEAPESIHSLWFRCLMDDGRLSPDPMPSQLEWGFEGYLGFLEETHGRWRDVLRCVRRSCFAQLRYPDNWVAGDKYHLDFARHFRTRIYPDVMRLYHQDAANRLIYYALWLDPKRDSVFFQDQADGLGALLREYGRVLARVAPGQYRDYLQRAASTALLADRRRASFAYAAELAVRSPLLARAWMLVGASLIGPVPSRQLQRVCRRLLAWARISTA